MDNRRVILSLENRDRLFWLGRYSERVYTTLKYFAEQFDSMIDRKNHDGIYTSKEDFAQKYCFNEDDPNSVYYGLMRAYDNAIELREEIGSDTFSYIQMAVYEMNRAKFSDSPLLQLQKVSDNIAAFWGMADDRIYDEKVRSIIKLGKRIERVDLYARMNADSGDIQREIHRLSYRIEKAGLKYDSGRLERLNELAAEDGINCPEIVKEVEGLIDLSRIN